MDHDTFLTKDEFLAHVFTRLAKLATAEVIELKVKASESDTFRASKRVV